MQNKLVNKQALLFGLMMMVGSVSAGRSQTELSLYGGSMIPNDSSLSGNDPGGIGAFSFVTGWQRVPPELGVRLTRWLGSNHGWGLDVNQSELRVEQSTLTDNRLTRLGYGGRVSVVTMNAYHRWPAGGRLHPYIGAGVGFAFPGFEYESAGGNAVASPLTGPAFQWVAGARFPLSERIALFGEYKGSYLVNNIELTNGGSIRADSRLNAINIGVALGF